MKFTQVAPLRYYDRKIKRHIEKVYAVTTRGNLVERFTDDPPGVFHRIPAARVKKAKRP